MDRRTLRAAAIALLVVLAVGIAAATLNSTLEGGDSLGPGGGGGSSSGEGGGGGEGQANRSGNFSGTGAGAAIDLCLPWFKTQAFQLAYLGLWLTIGGIVFWRLSSRPLAAALFLGVTVQMAAIYAILSGLCGRDIQEVATGNASELPSEPAGQVSDQLGQSGGEAGALISSNPILTAIILLVAAGLLVALVVLYSDEARDLLGVKPPATEEQRFDEEYDAQALRMLGQTAGEAADRLDESGDVDNEVYRAWREMTDHLEVDRPESSTPGEFATAAVAAGMDRQDVSELTDVFEEVRYGGLPPTSEAEERALAALRGIERSYGETEHGE